MSRRSTRRDFLKRSAAAGIGFWVAGGVARAESTSPNEKINIAVIGCGGKGHSDMQAVASENIVALCDVDAKQAEPARKEQPKANFYFDYRELLEKEKTVDAVIVATPDHMHAPASLMAMRLGKHCYTQKPLTHTVKEARTMRDVARAMKVVTQMGNQGSAENGLRRAVEVIQSGAIGDVEEVHVWSNRPIWPQGMEKALDAQPVPENLKWDLWLGVAADRAYNADYCPFKWRGWWDFGTGALGDMACHTANLPFRALKLEYPTSIEAKTAGINPFSPPKWSEITFQFPARGSLPPVKFMWYDGGKKPSMDVIGPHDLTAVQGGKKRKKKEELKAGDIPGSGCLLVGKKGKLFSPDDYGSAFALFPAESFEDYKGPAESIPRSPGHYKEWTDAIKGNGKAPYSNFDVAAYLTEIILLGNVAMRTGKRIDWDGPNMRSPNNPEANQFIHFDYRKGYAL